MRSLIAAILMIAVIAVLATVNSAAVTARVDELTKLTQRTVAHPTLENYDALRREWDRCERLFSFTVHVERVRSCEAALGELADSVDAGYGAAKPAAQLIRALSEIANHEIPSFEQIF